MVSRAPAGVAVSSRSDALVVTVSPAIGSIRGFQVVTELAPRCGVRNTAMNRHDLAAIAQQRQGRRQIRSSLITLVVIYVLQVTIGSTNVSLTVLSGWARNRAIEPSLGHD
jgi:hypothetical protein